MKYKYNTTTTITEQHKATRGKQAQVVPDTKGYFKGAWRTYLAILQEELSTEPRQCSRYTDFEGSALPADQPICKYMPNRHKR